MMKLGILGVAVMYVGTIMGAGYSSEQEIFNIFGSDYDRFEFPANVHRVTAGHGGEALLIIGSEKTVLLDCGMAYCGRDMVKNIEDTLKQQGRETLDFVLLSHSHYDHIGALPYVKKSYPDAVICGSRHCRDILERPGARKLMKTLGTTARDLYDPGSLCEIPVEHLKVDRILNDGEKLDIGEETLLVLETKGHTDCSLSFALEPVKLLFASESTGILEAVDYVHTPILKSFEDAFISMDKCILYGPEYICLPHFGMLPSGFKDKYWIMFKSECEDKIEFIREMKCRGENEEDMLTAYVERYWTDAKEKEQPREAYVLNSKNILKAILNHIQ